MDYKKVNIGGEEFVIPKLPISGLVGVTGVLIVLILVFSMFYSVGPDEVGVVLRFGKYMRTESSGLHVKMPFGIEEVKKPKIRKRFTETI